MASFVISNNNRLLLLPSLHDSTPIVPESRLNELDRIPLQQLLKADLTHLKESVPRKYTYGAFQIPRLRQHEDRRYSCLDTTSSCRSSVSSRDSIFSNESDDNGFSSSDEELEESQTDACSKEVVYEFNAQNLSPVQSRPRSRSRSRSLSVQIITPPRSANVEGTPGTEERSSAPLVEIFDDEIAKPLYKSNESDKVAEDITPAAPSDTTTVSKRNRPLDPKEDIIEISKPKRQRVGPSCDLCRFKKIKCDAHIEIMAVDVCETDMKMNKKSEITDKSVINTHLSKEELQKGFTLVYSNEKLIKFKSCSYCELRNKPCVYERGYTKDDILRYNLLRNIKKKKKQTSRKKRS